MLSYNKLLQKDGSFLIYHRLNQNLATKTFKVKNGLSLKTAISASLQKKNKRSVWFAISDCQFLQYDLCITD